jgi:hypothetical protein
MHEMDELRKIDLNLLLTLHALLTEKHVTRAAIRLHRSQPAVSHALAQLRAHFDDPLLVRKSGKMMLTGRAQSLLPALDAANSGTCRDLLRDGNPNLSFIYLKGDFEVIESRLKARKGHFFKTQMLVTQFDALQEPGVDDRRVYRCVSVSWPQRRRTGRGYFRHQPGACLRHRVGAVA